MDHKEWLAGLPSETTRALTQVDPWRGYLHLVAHVGLILGLGLWVGLGLPLWWMLVLPLGILQVFLFTLQHECTHKTPFAHRGMSELVGHAVGVLIVQPFQWFRYFHLAHHRHTNDPERDPELASPKPETKREFALHLSGLPTYVASIAQIGRNAFGPLDAAYLPRGAKGRLRREARLMLVGYALILWFVPQLFWIWVLPMLLGQPFLRLYLLAEHGRCPEVANMFLNTRTTFTNRLVRFLAWNMPYHAEHHIYPNVPFHNLPKLHVLVQDHLAVTAPGYAAFAKGYTRDLRA